MRTISAARVLLQLLAIAACAASTSSCRREPADEVVLYVSADAHIAREVIDRFQKQTGISVQVVGDTEAKKTTGLVERLRAEQSSPQADVFWSSEIVLTISLAEEGLFEEHLSDLTADWPLEYRDRQRRWFAFAARPRVIVYAPQRVPEADRPATWMDLTKGRWKNRIVMAEPRFGTTGTHLAAMKWHWDREVMPGYYSAWCMGMAANNARLLASGNAGVVDAVAKGEADVGLTDADDVWAARARGLDVELIYPAHSIDEAQDETPQDGGTLLIPNTVARIKGGPNSEAAGRLIDFLLSEEVERMLAESASHNVPIRPELAKAFPQFDVPHPLSVDWVAVAGLRSEAIEAFFAAGEAIERERGDLEQSRRDEQTDASSPSDSQPADRGGEDGR